MPSRSALAPAEGPLATDRVGAGVAAGAAGTGAGVDAGAGTGTGKGIGVAAVAAAGAGSGAAVGWGTAQPANSAMAAKTNGKVAGQVAKAERIVV